eukprot:10071501-Ditylum_brightwellii.AAC.1
MITKRKTIREGVHAWANVRKHKRKNRLSFSELGWELLSKGETVIWKTEPPPGLENPTHFIR